MRRPAVLVVLVALLSGAGCKDDVPAPTATTSAAGTASAAPAASDHAAEAVELVKAYGGALKKALMKGMGEGPAEAVKACNVAAPAIAETIEVPEGWAIGRTSLKLRSPKNAPDAWERKQLEAFEAKKKAGTPAAALVVSEIVEADGVREFRFMKAIPTEGLCLTCHGETIDSAVESELSNLYPKDQARGFAAGDLRGAFTLRKRL